MLYAELQENAMKSFSRLLQTTLTVTAVTVLCTVAFAQQTSSTIQTFNVEATLPYDRIGFATTPTIPSNVLDSIRGGALEIRQSVEQRGDGTLRVRHFLVAPGSPNPTPSDATATPLDDYVVRVDEVVQWPTVSATPPGTGGGPSSGTITYVGNVTQELASSPFGPLNGRPVFYSFGFAQPSSGSTSTGTGLTNVTLLIPGILTTFIANASGTLTFPGGSDGGPGTGGPAIGIADRINTLQTQFELDAMATDASGGPLTYEWRAVQGNIRILDPSLGKTRVQVPNIFGEHIVELKVTNPAGQSTTKRITILYSGTGPG
jgi:hypothetical protein